MNEPYVYPHTNTLINLANIQDEKKLSYMEAEYTSFRLAELVTQKSASCFDFSALCNMHYYILKAMNQFAWEVETLEEVAKRFSKYMADLWRTHPYREGNTRTIVTFCSQFIESKGFYIDSDLFRDNAQYMRTALVAASAVFQDLGDKRKTEYLDGIIFDALIRGQEMKDRVSAEIKNAGFKISEDRIRKIVNWNRTEWHEHNSEEIGVYLSAK